MHNSETLEGTKENLNRTLDKFTSSKTASNLYQVKDDYRALTYKVAIGGGSVYEREALNFFIPVCNAVSSCKEHLFANTSDTLLALLLEKDNLTTITNLPGGDEALAWFVCELSVAYVYDSDSHSKTHLNIQKNLAELLYKWSRLSLNDSQPPTLDVIVKHIYGEIYWDLYGKEKVGPRDFATWNDVMYDILAIEAPLSFRVNKDYSGAPNTNLPIDLTE